MRLCVRAAFLVCLSVAVAAVGADRIDLNEATQAQLVALGLSESRAMQIVSHRQKTGPFLQVRELAIVAQIRKEDLEGIRDLVRVGESSALPAADPPTEVFGSGQDVILEDVETEWQNLYGLIVFAASARVRNAGDEPLRYVQAKLELLDDDGKVVAETVGYNLAAEILASETGPRKREEKLTAIEPIAPGSSDFLRLSLEKTDIGKPFRGARISLLIDEAGSPASR